jgi:hypothetical protein
LASLWLNNKSAYIKRDIYQPHFSPNRDFGHVKALMAMFEFEIHYQLYEMVQI